MNEHRHASPAQEPPEFQPARLAEAGIVAVDLCNCGVLLVHIAAVTLRMDHAALECLSQTLARAVAQHSALKQRECAVTAALKVQGDRWGEA
jgi:hypothetical protein